jgi:integrase
MPRQQNQQSSTRVNGSVAGSVYLAEAEQLRLFDVGVDVASLRIQQAALSDGQRAAATRRAYASDWRQFSAWCGEAGRCPLPASGDTVALYVVSLAQSRSVATIERRLTSITAEHLAVGQASPVDGAVRAVVTGVRRKIGVAQAAKAALSVDDLRAMVAELPAGPLGARDRAVLVLGFASGLRRAELAALERRDVRIVGAGVVVTVRRSKTDQEGVGRELGVHRGRRVATCPVRALEAWLRERGNWPGPLFCRVVGRGRVERRGLAPAAIAGIVQRAAASVGLDPTMYAGHSLRAGCVTAAAEAGAGEAAIMQRTGHRSTRVLRRYIRHGTVFAVNPLAGAL